VPIKRVLPCEESDQGAGWQQADFSKNGVRIRGIRTNIRPKITGRLAYLYPKCCSDEMMDQILEFSKLNLAL
jgi:hypothetical protein